MLTGWDKVSSILPLEDLLVARGYSVDHPFTKHMPDVKYLIDPPLTGEGVLDAQGEFLLNRRWVTPLRLPDGRVVSYIGWTNGGGMKYLTCPTPWFNKRYLLFGVPEALRLSRHYVYVVEGVFDCLALQSIGVPCVSLMGSSCSPFQLEQLKLWKVVRGIPDRDILDKVISRDAWKIGNYLTWNFQYPCKDIDDMVELFGEDLRGSLHTLSTGYYPSVVRL